MHIYRVTYARNEIISCQEVDESPSLTTPYHYEHEKGLLIYAMIKAENVGEATKIAKEIVVEVTSKSGKDFISS